MLSKYKHKKNWFYFFLLIIAFVITLQTVSLDSTSVIAQSLDSKAETTCKNNKAAHLDICVKGFKWGFNGDQLDNCKKEWPNTISREYSSCNSGYTWGHEAAKQDDPKNKDPDSPRQTSAAAVLCDKSEGGKYSDEAEIRECKKGYRERAKGSNIAEACAGLTGVLVKACEYGWGDRNKQTAQAKLNQTAQEKCKKEFPNDNNKLSYCIRGYIGAKDDLKKNELCGADGIRSEKLDGVPSKFKDACEKGYDLAKPGDAGDKDGQATDCDALGGGPLGWIMCPLIDLGANISDLIFDQVIKPLLSDIPLTTDNSGNNTGFYTAWNSFRFLANIMIIGSMLAIVYAQARGDK